MLARTECVEGVENVLAELFRRAGDWVLYDVIEALYRLNESEKFQDVLEGFIDRYLGLLGGDDVDALWKFFALHAAKYRKEDLWSRCMRGLNPIPANAFENLTEEVAAESGNSFLLEKILSQELPPLTTQATLLIGRRAFFSGNLDLLNQMFGVWPEILELLPLGIPVSELTGILKLKKSVVAELMTLYVNRCHEASLADVFKFALSRGLEGICDSIILGRGFQPSAKSVCFDSIAKLGNIGADWFRDFLNRFGMSTTYLNCTEATTQASSVKIDLLRVFIERLEFAEGWRDGTSTCLVESIVRYGLREGSLPQITDLVGTVISKCGGAGYFDGHPRYERRCFLTPLGVIESYQVPRYLRFGNKAAEFIKRRLPGMQWNECRHGFGVVSFFDPEMQLDSCLYEYQCSEWLASVVDSRMTVAIEKIKSLFVDCGQTSGQFFKRISLVHLVADVGRYVNDGAVVRCVIQGTPGINPADRDFFSFFLRSVKLDRTNVCRVLIECKAIPDACRSISLLHAASTPTLEVLLQGGARVDRFEAGITRLMTACLAGCLADTEILIKYGANVNAKSRVDGLSPLMMANWAGERDGVGIAKLLLSSSLKNVKVNLREKKGRSALYYAILFARSDLVELLVANGADCESISLHGEDRSAKSFVGRLMNGNLAALRTDHGLDIVVEPTLCSDNYTRILHIV